MIKTEKINQNIDWVQVTDCLPVEKKTLKKDYQLTNEMLYYALDRHERPRLEYYEEEQLLLIIFDVAEPTRFSGDISSEPIGIILRDTTLFTFTADKTNFVNPLIRSLIDKLPDVQRDNLKPLDVVLKTLYQLAIQFFDYINHINSIRTSIQRGLHGRTNKKAINQLLNLQTDLVYFLTSLSANNDMLMMFKRKLGKTLSDDDNAALDDVIVEIQQGLSMAQMANQAAQQVANAYSNLLDSNINNTMKFLTVFSIALTVPNIVFGFYGENVELPFMHNQIAWQITLLISLILVIIVLLIMHFSDFFNK
ncbi:Magnesium and cobalt transport protein CorA [Fructilactobacillus florum 8D]|uniref:Magnesium and cobalt transport protein CorA n=3 Tax=Fructilactobacillus florum TaxID=640331 RepID=W9EI58_9LACO|nr:magnesium transporter CorA family protein [Fructilactobacillus florum]EKK21100.1 Magnesium and cobalt transport protein CorA [Fructilactobacillus florum 2F]ETO40690.1 Magnesium and cobalt transport protein CorA [Fructilactobacillus florum 8D]